MATNSYSLRVEHLSASYGRVTALRDVTIDVAPGEAVAVIGPNGAGKTTLLRAVSGLVRQTSGKVLVDNREVTRTPAYKVARAGLAHVPEGRGMIPSMTVRENLLVAAPRGLRGVEAQHRAESMCKAFPLLERLAGRRAGLLSGGEQQVLAIARGLMAEPKVIAIDEPSMGLAPVVIKDIMEMLRSARARGTAVLLMEQNVALASSIADRMYVLAQGEIRAEGSPSDLPADVLATYIGAEGGAPLNRDPQVKTR